MNSAERGKSLDEALAAPIALAIVPIGPGQPHVVGLGGPVDEEQGKFSGKLFR